MTVGDVDRSWRTSRLVTINDVYTFEKASGHGGFAAASTLINELRRGHQGDCLVTVNGDFLGGSLLAEQSKGEVVIEILNHIGIDACVLGNHEFDFSTSVLERRIGESKFDWYGANVTKLPENRMLPGCIDRKVVVTRSGLRLGVFGVCTPATPKLSYPCDLTRFHDVIATAKQAVAALQQEGADLIIALTHLRLAADVDLAKECPEVHIVLGGHDHDPFSQLQNGQLVLKCGQNAYWVGVVDIHWRRKDGADGVEFFLSYSMHSTCNTDEDPACIDIVRRCQEKFEPVDPEVDLDEVLVRCTGAQLDTRTSTVRVCEASSGNLVADAMYSFFMAHGAEPDLACINGGFIRGDRLYPEDGVDITRRLLYEEMPFPYGPDRSFPRCGNVLTRAPDLWQQARLLHRHRGSIVYGGHRATPVPVPESGRVVPPLLPERCNRVRPGPPCRVPDHQVHAAWRTNRPEPNVPGGHVAVHRQLWRWLHGLQGRPHCRIGPGSAHPGPGHLDAGAVPRSEQAAAARCRRARAGTPAKYDLTDCRPCIYTCRSIGALTERAERERGPRQSHV